YYHGTLSAEIFTLSLHDALPILNGNQTMILMTRFLLENWKKDGKINGNQFIASTIVSTPMMKVLADTYKVKYRETLTGFKWIARTEEHTSELQSREKIVSRPLLE